MRWEGEHTVSDKITIFFSCDCKAYQHLTAPLSVSQKAHLLSACFFQRVDEWMAKEGLLDPSVKSIFVTCGDWDLKVM